MKLAAAVCAAAALIGISSWVVATDASHVARSRAARIETTACGDASRTEGVGVRIGGSSILVNAHVVIGAGSVTVDVGHGPIAATIIALDPRSDLAIVEAPGIDAPPIVMTHPVVDDDVSIATAVDEFVTAKILRLVEVRIESVRSTERISRFGFEFDRTVDLGDSGAGVYNQDGHLVGVVFGRSTTRADRSFAVRTSEVEQLLAQETLKFVCSPAEDRVVTAE